MSQRRLPLTQPHLLPHPMPDYALDDAEHPPAPRPAIDFTGANRGSDRYRRREPSDIQCVIVHNTGPGPWRRHLQAPDRYPSPMEAAIAIYERFTDAGPHYIVDQRGRIAQTCDESLAAWHTGSRGAWQYTSKFRTWRGDPRYSWWFEDAPVDDPTELAGGALWASGSANDTSIGIEVVPAENTRAAFSRECMESLHRLCTYLCDKYVIPLTPEYVFAHCIAHPIARTSKFGRYDTFRDNGFETLFDM